jgi:hypothetical protein
MEWGSVGVPTIPFWMSIRISAVVAAGKMSMGVLSPGLGSLCAPLPDAEEAATYLRIYSSSISI